MAKDFNLKAIISAVDKVSPVLFRINKNLGTTRRQFEQLGKGAPALSAGLVAALAVPTKAFADFEQSSISLQNALLDRNGNLPAIFEKINQQAIELGNQLPGATRDFNRIAASLKGLGVAPEEIANGALKATAYLAVVGKDLHVTYESAAESVGKLSKSFAISGDQLPGFADSLQRALFAGQNLTDLQYAFAKVSGSLASVGVQGKKVADEVLPLITILTNQGYSGEDAGTALAAIIDQSVKAGKFKGIQPLIADLDRLNHLPSLQRVTKANKLFGEHGRKARLITLDAYNKQVELFANQADIYKKVANASDALSNKAETVAGTLENTLASIGAKYSPTLKGVADSLNGVIERAGGFINKNPQLVLTATKVAGAFVGLKVASYGVALGLGAIQAAIKTNPFLILAQAAVVAAPIIIDNWSAIVDRLKTGAERLLDFFTPLIETLTHIIRLVNNNKFLQGIGNFAIDIGKQVGHLLPDLSAPVGPGMRPPGYDPNQDPMKQSLIRKQNGSVDVNVSFNNAPQGLRVAPVQTSGPVRATQNVGYRTIGTAAGVN